MSDTLQEAPIFDWANFVIIDGELETQSVAQMFVGFDKVTDLQGYVTTANDAVTSSTGVIGAAEAIVRDALISYFQDLAAEDIVPYGTESDFWLWLEYQEHTPSFDVTGDITAYLAPLVSQWASYRGYNPGPRYVPPPPPVLPSPSIGKQTVTSKVQPTAPAHVSGGTPEGTSGTQVSAAIAIAFVDAMRVLADVVDAFLPNIAPGQVPQALDQLNTATTVLERQMTQVLTDLNPNSQGALAAQLQGALQTLHGLAQEVNILHDQMGEKADSGLEDNIKAVQSEADTNKADISTINSVTIPEIGAELAATAAAVQALKSQVNDSVVPELNAVKAEADATTTELSGTDKECLDQLCEALNAATNPPGSQPAGSSPFSLLKSLLTKGAEILALMTLADGILGILDMQLAVSGVVSDTTTITRWAEQSAAVITADLTWGGGLNLS